MKILLEYKKERNCPFSSQELIIFFKYQIIRINKNLIMPLWIVHFAPLFLKVDCFFLTGLL